MIVQGTSVGLDVHALSVVAHGIDEETGKVARARLCPDYGEVLGSLGQLRAPVRVPGDLQAEQAADEGPPPQIPEYPDNLSSVVFGFERRQPVRLRLEARRKELMHAAVGPFRAPCCRWIDR